MVACKDIVGEKKGKKRERTCEKVFFDMMVSLPEVLASDADRRCHKVRYQSKRQLRSIHRPCLLSSST